MSVPNAAAKMQNSANPVDDKRFRAKQVAAVLAALKDCSSSKNLQLGREIHADVMKMGRDLINYVSNTLVVMYAKCGSMVDAHIVFDQMETPTAVSWNVMILGYVQNGQHSLALKIYERMLGNSFKPDALVIVGVLKACGSLASEKKSKQVDGKLVKAECLQMGRAIHSEAVKMGHALNIYVATTLVDMYAKCGSMIDARKVFDSMKFQTVVSWTAMILGYAEARESELALQLYVCMQIHNSLPDRVTFIAALKACGNLVDREDQNRTRLDCLVKSRVIHFQLAKKGLGSDIFVATAVLDAYVKSGSMLDARLVFDRMTSPTVVSWSAIMLGYAESGEGALALQLYKCMQEEGCKPNRVTFVAALKACDNLGALKAARQIQAEIVRARLFHDPVMTTCLVDLYGKVGSMVDAQQAFDSMMAKNIMTWNALIAGYSRLGDSKQVMTLFERLLKAHLQPNAVTFVSVLSACSHAGLVEEGQKYFEVMCSEYGIMPGIEHYTCMVDLFGRANRLHDAVELVRKMPLEPDVVMWGALLSVCNKWDDVKIGRIAYENILRLDDKNSAAHVSMANFYACA